MMVAMMPMAGAGFFGMQLGMMAPVMTLVMPLVYGAVLGGVYVMLLHREVLNSASGAPYDGELKISCTGSIAAPASEALDIKVTP